MTDKLLTPMSADTWRQANTPDLTCRSDGIDLSFGPLQEAHCLVTGAVRRRQTGYHRLSQRMNLTAAHAQPKKKQKNSDS